MAGTAWGALEGSSLLAALDDCWSEFKGAYPQKLDRVTLDVHLSSAHVFVGLMELRPSESAISRSDAWKDIVESWAGQVWHQAPGTRITRWQRLDNTGAVLVSSTDRNIHEALLRFAQRHQMRLRSCLPAALSPQIMDSTLESSGSPHERAPLAMETLILWTEFNATGQRIAPVQLLRWAKGSPNAIWRGWLPPRGDIQDEENALKGAVRRFLGLSQEASHLTVLRTRWPSGMNAHAPSGDL